MEGQKYNLYNFYNLNLLVESKKLYQFSQTKTIESKLKFCDVALSVHFLIAFILGRLRCCK